METFKRLFPDVSYVSKCYDAVINADAAVIVTEWNEYRTLDLRKMKSSMRGNVLLDTRNVIDPEDALEAGFVYEGVGR